jgi:acyl carrier protein
MTAEQMADLDLRALLHRLFPDLAEPIKASSPLHGQGINSMGMIVLITHLQDEFGIVFDYHMLANLHELTFATIQALCVGRR